MSHALLDVLTGRFPDGRPIGDQPAGDNLSLSIRGHLQRLFNARRCALPHLPGYGMPDIAAVYEALPYSIDYLVAAVQRCIETYELRLNRPQVRPLPFAGASHRLQLEISGRTGCGQALKYRACFCSSGSAEVLPGHGESFHG